MHREKNSFKDYIAVPKTNGYQSIHTLVTGPFGLAIEIQIRTAEMDKVCESGVAAHWLYKSKDSDVNTRLTLARNWLGGLLNMQKNTGSSLEFYENMKSDLLTDEIYVFTPRGKIIQLPLQATVLDFAYAIHTNVGSHAVSATINDKHASLKQKLGNRANSQHNYRCKAPVLKQSGYNWLQPVKPERPFVMP